MPSIRLIEIVRMKRPGLDAEVNAFIAHTEGLGIEFLAIECWWFASCELGETIRNDSRYRSPLALPDQSLPVDPAVHHLDLRVG